MYKTTHPKMWAIITVSLNITPGSLFMATTVDQFLPSKHNNVVFHIVNHKSIK